MCGIKLYYNAIEVKMTHYICHRQLVTLSTRDCNLKNVCFFLKNEVIIAGKRFLRNTLRGKDNLNKNDCCHS